MPGSVSANLRSEFFDQADVLFYLFDKDLNLIDVNEGGLKAFRFKRDDIVGKNLAELSPDNVTSGRFERYKEVIRTGQTLVIDEMKPHPSLGNMHFRIKAFKVGEGLGLVSKDITDLKESIDELETFIYKSTHDMRSPIASILGLTSLANEQVKDLEEAKHFCGLVQEQTKRLDMILQTLMETMRIRQGDKIIHLIDFNQLLGEVQGSLRYMPGYSAIKFDTNITVGKKFYSDKMLLTSLFQNLLDNAIKYRKSIEDPFVSISVTDENGGVVIKVSDNGIGIAEEMQKDVFKMFFRGTNQASGSGLGLYTVSYTIKKLNGMITLESEKNVGTTFTIYVPNEMRNE